MPKNISINPAPFSVKKIYAKSASFQSPGSPAAFANGGESPSIDVHIRLSNEKLDHPKPVYEVNMTVAVVAKNAGEQVFSVEVQQAGLFEITTEDGKELSMVLEAGCPGVLFPYARETISSLVTQGGFAQLLLDPINFAEIYRNRRYGEVSLHESGIQYEEYEESDEAEESDDNSGKSGGATSDGGKKTLH